MTYQLFQQIKWEPEAGEYLTYGIVFEDRKIEDLSTDQRRVCALIALLNREQPHPAQLRDVLEDFFAC